MADDGKEARVVRAAVAMLRHSASQFTGEGVFWEGDRQWTAVDKIYNSHRRFCRELPLEQFTNALIAENQRLATNRYGDRWWVRALPH